MFAILRRLRNRFLGRLDVVDYRRKGARIGENVHLGPGCRLDPSHAWLITIEDDVTLAPNVVLLAHDGCAVMHLGVNYIAPIHIGRRAFIGANAVVLPGVTIGEDAIIGSGAVVTADVPAGKVAVGVPARVVAETAALIGRHREQMKVLPTYSVSGWTVEGMIPADHQEQQRNEVRKGGYVAAARTEGWIDVPIKRG